MSTCPPRDEWLRNLDGEVTANRAAELAAHAGGCTACRTQTAALDDIITSLRAPTVATGPATVARVMAALDDPPAKVQRTRWPWLAGGLAFAAAALLLLVLRPRASTEDEFTPRGTRTAPVAIVVHALDGKDLRRLEPGAWVTPATAYVASYRNTGATAYVMVFAIDAKGDVHWLYPAFTDAASDPLAVQIGETPQPSLFGETVVLDAPASGAMNLVVLVTAKPLRVSDIEQLPIDQRSLDALRMHWPDADVTSTLVDVR
jgi:hypothetical protein